MCIPQAPRNVNMWFALCYDIFSVTLQFSNLQHLVWITAYPFFWIHQQNMIRVFIHSLSHFSVPLCLLCISTIPCVSAKSIFPSIFISQHAYLEVWTFFFFFSEHRYFLRKLKGRVTQTTKNNIYRSCRLLCFAQV